LQINKTTISAVANSCLMEAFKEFILNEPDTVMGGDLHDTYIGRNGDLYDTETERMVFFD